MCIPPFSHEEYRQTRPGSTWQAGWGCDRLLFPCPATRTARRSHARRQPREGRYLLRWTRVCCARTDVNDERPGLEKGDGCRREHPTGTMPNEQAWYTSSSPTTMNKLGARVQAKLNSWSSPHTPVLAAAAAQLSRDHIPVRAAAVYTWWRQGLCELQHTPIILRRKHSPIVKQCREAEQPEEEVREEEVEHPAALVLDEVDYRRAAPLNPHVRPLRIRHRVRHCNELVLLDGGAGEGTRVGGRS